MLLVEEKEDLQRRCETLKEEKEYLERCRESLTREMDSMRGELMDGDRVKDSRMARFREQQEEIKIVSEARDRLQQENSGLS